MQIFLVPPLCTTEMAVLCCQPRLSVPFGSPAQFLKPFLHCLLALALDRKVTQQRLQFMIKVLEARIIIQGQAVELQVCEELRHYGRSEHLCSLSQLTSPQHPPPPSLLVLLAGAIAIAAHGK